jgi:twinfilin-like protein
LSEINSSGPRYVAIRYDDNGNDVNIFILFCPDTAPPRQKMMSSTCKHSFLKGCEEIGLKFEKSFEIREGSEFTDAYVDSLVHPVEVDHGYGELKAFKKPARPGRREG